MTSSGWAISGEHLADERAPILCPRVVFDCGHVAYIWPEEYGDGSAWCQTCGDFQCYDRCERCWAFDCDHRDTK